MDELLFFEPDKKKHIPPVSIDNSARLATNTKESDQQLVNSANEWMCLQVSPTQSKLKEASPTRVVSVQLRQLILLLLWYRVLECQPFLQCPGRFWASSNLSRSSYCFQVQPVYMVTSFGFSLLMEGVFSEFLQNNDGWFSWSLELQPDISQTQPVHL